MQYVEDTSLDIYDILCTCCDLSKCFMFVVFLDFFAGSRDFWVILRLVYWFQVVFRTIDVVSNDKARGVGSL